MFEFTLLGPGYGECVIIHYGEDEWIIVDSCINEAGEPAALHYLKRLGVDVATAVRLIAVTHWHDDHIRGVSQLVQACRRADIACPAAFRRHEFLTLVAAYADGAMMLQTGVREMAEMLALLNQRGTQVRLALENTLLLRRNGFELYALSPSGASTIAAMRHVSAQMPQAMQSKVAVAEPTPNHLSVALLATYADCAILLGGDVLRFNDRNRGWLRIVDLCAESNHPKSDIVKIPHHGSPGADSQEMWNHLLSPRPIAALTPFCRGRVLLPEQTDKARISGQTQAAYITARPHRTRPARRSSAVEKTVAGVLRNRRLRSPRFGRVTLRSDCRHPVNWTVELFGAAYQL